MIPGWRTSEHPYSSRDEWLEMRKADITASDAGALWGAHKYTTRRKLFLSKSFGENDEQSAVMRRGKIMEPAVAEAIVVDCGWKPERCSSYLRGRAADPLVRLGATRDYRLTVDADDLLQHPKTRATALAAGWSDFTGRELRLTVECKSVDPAVWEKEWQQGPPVYTVVQSAQQTLLEDADGGLVAALLENRTKDLILYAVRRDPDFEHSLVEQVRGFWRAYEAGEEPEVCGGDNEHMTDYYPTSDESLEVDLADDAAYWTELVLERETLKAGQKTLQKRIDEIEAHIKDRMRDAARAILPGWSITWRTDSRGTRTFKVDRARTKLTPTTKRTRR
jgi:predicted phage-related endonuclease